jgi:hypothetical protein
MNKKVKSFYEWFFREKLVLPNPKIDEGTKRLGKILATFGGGGFLLFTLFHFIDYLLYYSFDIKLIKPEDLLFYLSFLLLGPLSAWIGYRIFRWSFWSVIWVIEGFGKPKE